MVVLGMGHLERAHSILRDHFADDPEPIPPWSDGDVPKLESLVGCTEVSAFGVEKYQGVEAKAAKIFYSAVKAHAFPNGNKRFGVVILFTFLVFNGYQFAAPSGYASRIAKLVAELQPTEPGGHPDAVIEALTPLIRDAIKPL